MDGVAAVVKPAGLTSHDVVNRVRRICSTRRVGHAGTLDPIATGVLVVCVGRATRIVEFLDTDEKEYVARIVFGRSTDTQDRTGATTSERDASHLTLELLQTAVARFVGPIQQIPPMASAVHHEGRRLYEIARAGETVERAPRSVEIGRLEVLDFTPGPLAQATLRVVCSAGTYIRTLASDIGDALGVGGSMEELERTRSGRFTLDRAVTLEQMEAAPAGALAPIATALDGVARIVVGPAEIADIGCGRSIAHCEPIGPLVLALSADGAAVAICDARDGRLHPRKVLAPQGPAAQ